MSKRAWLAVALVIGGGILLQIPSWGSRMEHQAGDGHDHTQMESAMTSGAAAGVSTAGADVDAPLPGTRTVRLEVTGMT